MGEWLKPAVLKTVSLERGSGVRIPLPPPLFRFESLAVREWRMHARPVRGMADPRRAGAGAAHRVPLFKVTPSSC